MKLCAGTSEEPRRTHSGRTYCPECHRPCTSRWEVDDRTAMRRNRAKIEHIEFVVRHYPDGTKPKGRGGVTY